MNPSRLKRRPDKLLDAPDAVCSTGCTGRRHDTLHMPASNKERIVPLK